MPESSTGDNPEKKYRKAFFLLLIAAIISRLFYIQWMELAPDEAYGYTGSRNWPKCILSGKDEKYDIDNFTDL
jgi:hypothetical protein